MPLQYLSAWFFAGVLLTNVIPHFVSGVQGRDFQSPFGKPPGVGLSPPRSNIVWGFANLVLGWTLLSQVGRFEVGRIACAAPLGAGILAMGLYLARYFSRFNSSIE